MCTYLCQSYTKASSKNNRRGMFRQILLPNVKSNIQKGMNKISNRKQLASQLEKSTSVALLGSKI